MKSAVFLYNTQSGKCKIGHCTDSICTVFRAYGYEITPQPIDFEANPFDGNEQIDLMVVAGGDGTVNYVVNSMKSKGLDIPLGVIPAGTANDFAGMLGVPGDISRACRAILDGEEHLFEGIVEGHIAQCASGSEGFGYDPLFIPEGSAKTYAEMDPAEKNALSHRGRAVRKLAEFLHNRGK